MKPANPIHINRTYLRQLCTLCGGLWLLLCSLAAPAEPQEVIIPLAEDLPATDIRLYYKQLLQLALEKTRDTDGDYTIIHNNNAQGPERERAMLMAGAGLTVTWGTVTAERKAHLQVVPVDLVKNLNSYRALIIRSDSQVQFNKVAKIDDLRQLNAGAGINWSSNSILLDNGLKLVTSGSFSGIYKMLANGRVDYVARAPYEVEGELADYGHYSLILENRLLLQFSQPQEYCFFVNKHNTRLAKRLERGLRIAKTDGSFDALFASYPGFVHGHQLIQNPTRITLSLMVPGATPAQPPPTSAR